MPSLDSINFDASDFSFRGDEDNVRVWHTQDGDGIGLFYFPIPPDIEADIQSVDEVRSAYRKLTESSGNGLVECDTQLIDGCRTVRTIISVPFKTLSVWQMKLGMLLSTCIRDRSLPNRGGKSGKFGLTSWPNVGTSFAPS